MKTCVITATIGEGRRRPYTPSVVNPNCEYICFSDRPFEHEVWEVRVVEKTENSNTIDAKKYKVLTHKYIDCDQSIWIDRHCRLRCDPEDAIDLFKEDLGLVNHFRNCIFLEGRACRSKNKDDVDLINKTCVRFRREGWKQRAGLYYGGFVMRRHTEKNREFSELWWEYINYGTRRDQISLPVAVKRSGISRKIFSRKLRGNFFVLGRK